MRKIKLTQGLFAQVSDEDYDYLVEHKWQASLESRGTKHYAIRWAKKGEGFAQKTKIRMHCVILRRTPRPTDGMVVHHKDDDGLNNQRENLEVISQEQNMRCANGWKKKSDSPFL